jgi:lysophospholipase L1-like esterase
VVDDPAEVEFSVDLADPLLRYVGRWDRTDPSLPRVGWQGARIEFRFDGSAAAVALDAGSAKEFFRVVVDGDRTNGVRFAAAPGVASYDLATALPSGVHTIELIKETDAGDGATLHGLTLHGHELLEPSPGAVRRMEFYGDSGAAGDSLTSERNASGWKHVGCDLSYPALAARALGADYHNLSISGETIAGMQSHYDRRFRDDRAPSWNFAEFPADVVVIDLGSNDIFEVGKAEVKRRYVALLDLLRAAHPDAHLVLFCSYGWSKREPANYAGDVVAQYGDPNVSFATFPWLFEQYHGCEYDHAGAASYLVAHLGSVLGWEAASLDVMSGFGSDGDVANGGFESIAPFGGYGWRYFDAPGVARVVDASQAQEGGAFLRLGAGGTVHQPNPARDGQTVTVTAWLRGDAPGASADLTLDFRDQEQGSTPIESETTRIALTTAWEPYTVTAVAPGVPGRPVFHTRLTIVSSSGTVDVDGVSMTTQ